MPFMLHGGELPFRPLNKHGSFWESPMEADGLNLARAMRIAEIMQDYREIMAYFAHQRFQVPPELANTDGYLILRQSAAEARQLLNMRYDSTSISPDGDSEREKTQLRQVLIDAGLRRHRAQKLYLRVLAAQRWVQSRDAALQSSSQNTHHARQLAQINVKLREELQSITDTLVEHQLRMRDTDQGKWLVEDPSLAIIQQLLHHQRFR